MTNIKQIIDFELIQKKINNSISEEEELIFQNWLSENDANNSYYENAQSYYKDGSYFDHNTLDTSEAWLNVKEEVSTKKIYIWKKAGKFIAATAAVLTLLLLSYNVLRKSNSYSIESVGSEIRIIPGKAAATLTFSDGTKQNLVEDKFLEKEIDGVKILSDGKSISYVSQKVEKLAPNLNTLEIPRGGEYVLELSDGTKVWLNAETILKFPVQFQGDERRVELSGEAYFEVAHNQDKPFYVQSGNQTIRVLGTSFNVSSYANDQEIITTLLEGSVEVSSESERQILSPNQQSLLNRVSGNLTKNQVRSNEFVLWKSGKFYFHNMRLVDIMKILGRWYDIEVFYDNDEIQNVRLTGGFLRYDTFDQVKKIIETTGSVKVLLKGNTVLLK